MRVKAVLILATVSSKGQITLPIQWKQQLRVEVGDIVYFHFRAEDQFVFVSTEGGDFSQKSKLFKQNLLTIPVSIRNYCGITPGDKLEFGYDEKKEAVYFRKSEELGSPSLDLYKLKYDLFSPAEIVVLIDALESKITLASRRIMSGTEYSFDKRHVADALSILKRIDPESAFLKDGDYYKGD